MHNDPDNQENRQNAITRMKNWKKITIKPTNKCTTVIVQFYIFLSEKITIFIFI